MRVSDAEVDVVARRLLSEHRAREPFRPFAEELVATGLETAYRIQDRLDALYSEAGRGHVAGYKIALTSRVMQEFVGVDHPLAGAVFSSGIHPSPATLRLDAFQHVGVEFEVAVRLAADLPAQRGPHDRETVAEAVAACIPAFELIDDRHARYEELDGFGLAADNAWNAGVVLGVAVTDWRGLDLADGATRLAVNGVHAGEGRVGDALGHPLDALAWLANHMNVRGRALSAGQFVMTGSSIKTVFPDRGDVLDFDVEGLGGVRLTLN